MPCANVHSLQQEAERARAQESSAPTSSQNTTTKEPKKAPPPRRSSAADAKENPLLGPASLLTTLRTNFNSVLLKDPSFALGINSTNERAQKEANSVLSSWVVRMNRAYKKPISWPVQILSEEVQNNGDVLYKLQVLGPNGKTNGKPFFQSVPDRIARRVDGWRNQPNLAQLILKGLLEPKLTIIPKKQDSGPINTEVAFDDGQVELNEWVRFQFTVRVSSIMPIFVEPADNAQSGGPQGEP